MCHVGGYRLGLNVWEAHEETELKGVKTSSKKMVRKIFTENAMKAMMTKIMRPSHSQNWADSWELGPA